MSDGLTKADITPVIRSAAASLLKRASTHQDAALIAGAFLAVAVELYREVGGAKFAEDVLRQIINDLGHEKLQ